ncbi:formylglycine-generating enzyme family protein [Candidatus Poribacteria bacterium]|nr:formylglycine-generating enzyme family protein [Candidatus Poribacteria bacterium]MYB64853.1 formylglycine-generating enzyme family protein [Candidatus Poribacteria bacterium]MYF57411.1 formylglycine-generating enzyme family protein [Candidatus Poribacteria bacterium]
MKRAINVFVFIMIGLFLSCGSDSEDRDMIESELVQFISAKPESGSPLHFNESVTVFFNRVPDDLTVEPGMLNNLRPVTITGPFPIGKFNIELTWQDGTQTLEYIGVPEGMVMIQGGTFQMGSDSEMAAEDEQPIHTVFVDSFLMDTHEVTAGEYKQFVRETGHREPEKGYPTDKYPIVYVSWHDAMAYAKWTGKRLPTEAEWEYAARGGLEGRQYPWGNTPPDGTQCNFADKHLTQFWWADPKVDDGYTGTAPVGSYPENGYGLFDMAGNVLEWCLDEYDANFYTASQGANPISGANTPQAISDNYKAIETIRVLRGGSWIVNSAGVRSSTRFTLTPESVHDTVGFRCVINLEVVE